MLGHSEGISSLPFNPPSSPLSLRGE
jgi:hypothetical protein